MATREQLDAVERVSVVELAGLLRENRDSVVVVDVRNEDYELLGHIRGAEHWPKNRINDDAHVEALVAQLQGSKEVVFHCGHSHNSGPRAALRFIERLEADKNNTGPKPHVRVLDGGFAAFAEDENQKDLLELPVETPSATE